MQAMSRRRPVGWFDYFVRRTEPVLAERWGGELAAEVVADARNEYPKVAARLPYIGGWRNVFTPVIAANGWLIALHAAMKRRGKSAEETISVCAAVTEREFRSLPGWLLKLVGRLAFSRPSRWLFRAQAARSRRRRHPGDFVYEVEEKDGELSLVFSECAVNKHYDAEGLSELKPYCNFFDVTYSRLMDMGIDAHETIGLGCERCALRYKHGRETTVPDKLRGIVLQG